MTAFGMSSKPELMVAFVFVFVFVFACSVIWTIVFSLGVSVRLISKGVLEFEVVFKYIGFVEI